MELFYEKIEKMIHFLWIIKHELTIRLTVELYSLKFEIDFGVITDRGVFIEEIFAQFLFMETGSCPSFNRKSPVYQTSPY